MFSVRFSDGFATKLTSFDVNRVQSRQQFGRRVQSSRHKSVLMRRFHSTCFVLTWNFTQPVPEWFRVFLKRKEKKKTYSYMIAQEIPWFCETEVWYRLYMTPSKALLPKTAQSSPHSRYFKGPLQFLSPCWCASLISCLFAWDLLTKILYCFLILLIRSIYYCSWFKHPNYRGWIRIMELLIAVSCYLGGTYQYIGGIHCLNLQG